MQQCRESTSALEAKRTWATLPSRRTPLLLTQSGHERAAFAATHSPTCYTELILWVWGPRDAAARVHWLARRRRHPAFCIGRTKRRTGRRAIRAIGLVLLSIAIMALLLTDADAKRRSSAQGSQAAGASRSWCAVHPRHGSENCGYTSFDQCWATIGAEGGWCRPNPFSATPYGTGYTWSGPKR
jgi:hypothetical protein